MKKENNLSKQPISTVQWIHRDELSPNLYNPNRVAPPEMLLLRESIVRDGWLFPILVLDKSIHIPGLDGNENLDRYTIIDGFHRYTVSGHKDVYALTEGKVPVLVLNPDNPMATTVRMNRAKGTHGVLKMAEIVEAELKAGRKPSDLVTAYGMEPEEVRRLANRRGVYQSEEVVGKDWSFSWKPE